MACTACSGMSKLAMPAPTKRLRASATAGPPIQQLITGSGVPPVGWITGTSASAISLEGTIAVGAWMNRMVPVCSGCAASACSAST